MSAMPEVGECRSAVIVERLGVTQIVQYAGASGDFVPIHHDELFARSMGFPGIFAHGMLTMALTGRVLTDWFGVDALTEYGARFTDQVWPGDTLTATATVTAINQIDGETVADVDIQTTNQHGRNVLRGSAVARVSGEMPQGRG
jgi:acyl dehydratase